MPTFRIRVVSFCVIGALAACAGKQGGSHMPANPQTIIESAIKDAATRMNIDRAAIEVVRAESVTWSDGSLGCPSPGMQYTQALVPGYRVLLRAGDQTFDYHAAANGHFALCPPGRAIDPVADDRI